MKQALSILLTFALLVAIGLSVKGCYKQSVKKEVVSDLQAQTTTQEGEAIEKVIQIDRTISKLSDDDIDASLFMANDFWSEDSPRGEQSERVPSIPATQGRYKRLSENQAPRVKPQPSIPITVPYESCTLEYGFDDSDYVTVFEVCEDGR